VNPVCQSQKWTTTLLSYDLQQTKSLRWWWWWWWEKIQNFLQWKHKSKGGKRPERTHSWKMESKWSGRRTEIAHLVNFYFLTFLSGKFQHSINFLMKIDVLLLFGEIVILKNGKCSCFLLFYNWWELFFPCRWTRLMNPWSEVLGMLTNWSTAQYLKRGNLFSVGVGSHWPHGLDLFIFSFKKFAEKVKVGGEGSS